VLARDAGDFAAAGPLLTESLALFATLGEDEMLAHAEQTLGHVRFHQGERDAARAHLEASLERFRRLSPEVQARSASMFNCLNVLGKLAMREGNLAAARTHILEAAAHSRTVGGSRVIAHALTDVGVLHLELGEHSAAGPVLREALGVAAEGEDGWCILQALHALASAAAEEGHTRRAAVLTAAFEALGQRASVSEISEDLELPATGAGLRNALAGLDPTVREAATQQGAAMTIEEAVAYGLSDDEAEPAAQL
jgi:tetratricopeptide (TPR) repeat protein